jgi:hypothetical protein
MRRVDRNRTRAKQSDFAIALDEFVDEFYLDRPDKVAQQRRIDPGPDLTGVSCQPYEPRVPRTLDISYAVCSARAAM